MTPLYFGERSRHLFGIYHAGRADSGPTSAVVLCNAWGEEYNCSHRAVKQAAVSLAAAGLHTLRFDYFGTGDSAGDLQDATIAGWGADIRASVQEIKEMSGAKRVTLVGLRFGALLAAFAAAASPALIDRLVLWDPVTGGRTYLDELFRECFATRFRSRGPILRPLACGGGLELAGYPVTEALLCEIRELDLQSLLVGLKPPVFAFVSGDGEESESVHDALPSTTCIPIKLNSATPCWVTTWPDPPPPVPAKLIEQLIILAKAA